jgi:hypothetical protein
MSEEKQIYSQDSWAVVELMGHVTIAGRVTKPGEYGGLWQIDIPEGETFRTEFFGSQAVYRVKIVSESIARAYARPGHEVIEYDAPIITRDEHLQAMEKARETIERLGSEVLQLRDRLTRVNALPSGGNVVDKDGDLVE